MNVHGAGVIQGLRAGPAGGHWPAVAGYEILGELGRGAMGVVYQARQLGLNRLVALKMILDGEHAGAEQRARFRREAEAVARLHHPNIVQIYEIGEQDGRPFFSMEWVDGGSLARQVAGTPQNPGAAADFVQTLARAVQVAHEHGIIHRDLKPANILLAEDRRQRTEDRKGVSTGVSGLSSVFCPLSSTPMITDFGLAKQLIHSGAEASTPRQAGLTQSGAIMGSPSYMAPEQTQAHAEGVGPAADVYSLGAILYELLTGRPPFRAETALETVLQVRHEEPVPPRRLRPRLPRDLETICLTCLRKEPRRRYPSAEALAEDLRRFAAGEPIRARPVGVGERVLKWVRRRPALAALLVVSVAAVGVLVAADQRSKARLRAAQQRARDNFQEALQLTKRLVRGPVNDGILDDPVAEAARQQRFLEQAIASFQHFLEDKDNPGAELRRVIGVAHAALGRLHGDQGRRAQAEDHYRQAVAWLEPLLAEVPDLPETRAGLAWTYNNLANICQATGRLAAAEEFYGKALAPQQALKKDDPENPFLRRHLAQTSMNQATLFQVTGRAGLAEAGYRAALALVESPARAHPQSPAVPELRATINHNLARLLQGHGQMAAAEDCHRAAIDTAATLVRDYPTALHHQRTLAQSYHGRGTFYQTTNRPHEALADYRKALAILEPLARVFPKNHSYQTDLAETLINLSLLEPNDRREQAEASLRQAIAVLEPIARDQPTDVAIALNLGIAYTNLGYWAQLTGHPEAALDWYTRAAQRLDAVQRQEPRHAWVRGGLAKAHGGRAANLEALGRYPEAVAAWERHMEFDEGGDREGKQFTLVLLLVEAEDHVHAAAEARDLAEQPGLSASRLYQLARTHADAAALALRDPLRPAAERYQLAFEYATWGVDLLRKAVAVGLVDIRKLPSR